MSAPLDSGINGLQRALNAPYALNPQLSTPNQNNPSLYSMLMLTLSILIVHPI